MSEFLEVAPVLPARDDMITPSMESTSCLNAGIVEPVLPSVLNRGNSLLLPFVSVFSGKQPRGSIFDRLVPYLPPVDFIKHALSVTVHPMARPCPLSQIGWWTPLFRQQSLLVILSHIVGHSSRLSWKTT